MTAKAIQFDIMTVFPHFFESPFGFGILGRAIAEDRVRVQVHNLRDFTSDRHKTVDDRPFGGGEGMVLKPEPMFLAVESLGIAEKSLRDLNRERVVLLSAQGKPFTQSVARELAQVDRIIFLCGRYEGVDERVNDLLADTELSIGDYVISGGELAAAVIVDAVTRLLPGVLGNEDSTRYESFPPNLRRLAPKAHQPTTYRPRDLIRVQHAIPEDCSIILITLGRRSFAEPRCLRCSVPATMKTFAVGVGGNRYRRRCRIARIC